MKLNNQILRSRSFGPLNTVEYLDLSELGLVSLGRFSSCPKVVSVNLRDNQLQDASGLGACQQLWHLDLSNNQVCSVEGLSRFLALGSLILSSNQLTWGSLVHLRHMHILNLSLHGNPQLEKDPYYRIHVIDCLPNVWMLDGRIVTSAERIQVRQFFHDSALTERPVRRKLKKDGFIPSTLKKIEIDGIFGDKAVQMMTTFPKNAVLNVETDWKRLQYLAQTLQEDICLEWQYTARKTPGGVNPSQKSSFLTDLFSARFNDRERCNMVLLMLVASLDFVLPTHLVRDTLDTGKLLTIGSVQMMDLFLLPRLLRSKVVSLLVSAVKVDREQSEDGGLYTKLYLCLYHMIAELTRLSETTPANLTMPSAKVALQLEDYKCLLATEVVQLMCIVPSFFDYLDRDTGVMNLVKIATADPDINKKLIQISKMREDDQTSQNVIFKEMADFLLLKVQEQLQNLTNKATVMSACDRILSKSDALPMKGENTPVHKAEYLVRGVNAPDDEPPAVNPRKTSAKTRAKFPHLGDRMLLGPQTIGKIISLPQPTMALVIIDAVPVASGAVEHKLKEPDHHYTYVNMEQLQWDAPCAMWKPKGTVGDKFTLQAVADFNREALTGGMADDSFRPCTPEIAAAADLQAIRASTPLIYTNTPRQHVCIPTDRVQHRPKTRRPQRPLSSVYKERLKLTLDLSRRAQSAGARRPFAVTYGSKASTPKGSKVALLQLDQVSGLKVDLKGGGITDREAAGGGGSGGGSRSSRRGSSEITPSSASLLPPPPPSLTTPDATTTTSDGSVDSSRVDLPAAQSTPKCRRKDGDGKENLPPPPPPISSPTDPLSPSAPPPAPAAAASAPTVSPQPQQASKEQPLPTEEAEDSVPDKEPPAADEKQTTEKPEEEQSLPAEAATTTTTTTRSDSGTRWRDRGAGDAAASTKQRMEEWAEPAEPCSRGIFLTSVSESPRTFANSHSGHQLAGRSRPVSALERQRNGGGKAFDNSFHTEFQQQRIDAWKQTTRPAASPKAAQPTTTPPPPQPPSSPIPASEEAGAAPEAPLSKTPSLDTLSVASLPVQQRLQPELMGVFSHRIPRTNLWLAGGRDLFGEGRKQRPKSGHTPGWKEGLPDSMKPRPRSAAARLHRRSKTPSVYPPTPSSERTVLQGTFLNDFADFPANSQFSFRHLSRRYNSQRSLYDEDPLPGPVPENVYSPIKVLSYQHPRGLPSGHPCLPCVYEDYFHDLDFESQYTPACNTPTFD